MKEATGEMTTTIIVIIGLVGVLAIGTGLLWPKIREAVENRSDEIIDDSQTQWAE